MSFTRRSLLTGSGAVAVGLGAAACGSGEAADPDVPVDLEVDDAALDGTISLLTPD
ncbi:MAG: hypothetical protein ACTIMA_14750 [Brachybacterium tyrofermentans]|uniref:hypothetical protein n=1 Tax=Brachybacterium tyrofermentans TaxID=47848 RepID=UPI001865F1F1|nr:hypothetical protein [Brachybacterium tyrofermentans]